MSGSGIDAEYLAQVREAVREAIQQHPGASEKELLGAVMRALRGRCNPADAVHFIREMADG